MSGGTSGAAVADSRSDAQDDIDDTAGATEPGTDQEVASTARVRPGWARALRAHWRLTLIGTVFAACVGCVAALYFGQYRADQEMRPAVTKTVADAAAQGAIAMLSYTPDTVATDVMTAKSHLTGELLTYYSKFVDEIAAPAAKERGITTKAAVVRSAVAELHSDQAKVLIFVDQSTTSRDRPEPVQAASSVMVGMTKVHGDWLISSFDPV